MAVSDAQHAALRQAVLETLACSSIHIADSQAVNVLVDVVIKCKAACCAR